MSKRQEKRKLTGIHISRPVRRAEQRLAVAREAYSIGVRASRIGGKEYTSPGAKKCW